MSRDEQTYGKIREKYEAWIESEAERPERDHLRRVDSLTPVATSQGSEMSRMLFAAIGIGIGVVLLALAGFAFYTASNYSGFNREGAVTGYTVVGVFLLIAGFGGIAATWNHNFRVLTQSGTHHH